MKQKHKLYMIGTYVVLVLLLLLCTVNAQDLDYTNQTTQRWATIVYMNDFYPIHNVTITIKNLNTTSTIVSNATMTEWMVGRWYYNFTPNESGLYYEYFNYYNTSGIMAVGDDTFVVVDNIPNKTSEVFQMIFSTFILFAVGLSLLIVGKYIRNAYVVLVSGVWFIINTIEMSFDGQGWTFPLFFALVGLIILAQALGSIIIEWLDTKKPNRDLEPESNA